MEFIRRHPLFVTLFLAWIYLVGIVGLSLDISRDLFRASVPYTLLLSLLALAIFHEGYSKRFLIVAALIFLAGYFIEVIGVSSGVIFGRYSYGSTLGLKIIDTPLLIGVNWLTLIYMLWTFLGPRKLQKVFLYLIGAALMVFYDLFLEPVAIWHGMWSWEAVRVPLQNYVAWFAISFVFFSILGWNCPVIRNKIALPLFIVQLSFFIILNIIKALFF